MEHLSLELDGLMAEAVGHEGVTREEVERLRPRLEEAHRWLAEGREGGQIGFLRLPYADPAPVERLAAELRGWARDAVVLGIGGSALGTVALKGALLPPLHDLQGRPRLFVVDNVDPRWFSAVLEAVDWERAVFVLVSKSGTTAETAAQALVVLERMERLLGRAALGKHLVVITDPGPTPLRQLAEQLGAPALEVPPAVGGRFSVLSPVGLLPAALCGIAVRELLAGAAAVDRACREEDPWRNPAYLLAACLYLLDQRGKRIHVLMPYSNALWPLALWYRQLWAESLGKQGRGPTPVAALGATDQHSQLQLYLDGPRDKVVGFVEVERWEEEVPIGSPAPQWSYLHGHSLAELLRAERLATQITLTRRGCPNYLVRLPRLEPAAVGGLLFLFEVVTAVAGTLYGVNPFDQPAVEEGKRLARAALSGQGELAQVLADWQRRPRRHAF